MSDSKDAARLAEMIHRVRVQMKLTQKQAARQIGVRQQKLSDWENAKGLRQVLEAIRLLQWLQKPPA